MRRLYLSVSVILYLLHLRMVEESVRCVKALSECLPVTSFLLLHSLKEVEKVRLVKDLCGCFSDVMYICVNTFIKGTNGSKLCRVMFELLCHSVCVITFINDTSSITV